MTDLTITLTGEIRESNFDEWKDGLVERIRAVDVEFSADDDFKAANDSIRQFREAEQTLKEAKQAALEQAADINRLFDAVDAVTEETRQARLGLERKIRTRRQELKQQSLQAHIDGNAAVLDALPALHRALFQDRAALLSLPSDELAATIEQRIDVWQALGQRTDGGSGTRASYDADTRREAVNDESDESRGSSRILDAGDVPADDADGSTSAVHLATSADTAIDETARRSWRITIDLLTHRARAEQLFARVRDRWKGDGAVTAIEVSPDD